MSRTIILLLALSTSALLLAGCGRDADQATGEGHGDHGAHGDPADLPEGANATCPVMGGPVDPAIFTEYKGKKVYFCCDECVEKFKKDPVRYFEKAYPDAATR